MTDAAMTDAAVTDAARRIRDRLREAADPARAAGQQAYMKSAMPYLGVRVPEVRRIARTSVADETDAAALRRIAEDLWDGASRREELSAAMAVLGVPALRGDPALPELVERMVRTGRWWDITDELAHRVTEMLEDDPVRAGAMVRVWSGDEDLWVRRIAIISQLGRRARTDADLLAAVIEPNLADREFFIRKAIGWALRDYARTAPQWVRDFAGAHELSPLSRREALKHLG